MQTANPLTLISINGEPSRTVKLFTLGCKVNYYETQSIRQAFSNLGYREPLDGEGADICLINTCSVTAAADRKSKNIIRRCIKYNPQAQIIVTGCMVEKDSQALARIAGIDYIVSKRFFKEGIDDFSGRSRAFIKVQDGCNNFCTYCKIPLVRGNSRSRGLDAIIHEAQKLTQRGYQEIVLTGICLGAYGRDLSPQLSLSDILDNLSRIKALQRIRLSSIETWDITDEIIDKIKTNNKICQHLHIPIQSGDDQILKKMNRRIDRQGYSEVFSKLKRIRPELAITTDVIVGFPQETEESFKNTVALIKEIEPLKVHIFPYSPRQGTLAFGFRDKINPAKIKERICRLDSLARDCSFNYRKRFINRIAFIITEGKAKENDNYLEGFTDNYIRVLMKSNPGNHNPGLVKVILKEIKPEFMLAEPV